MDVLGHWSTVIDWHERQWVPLDDAERVRRGSEQLLTDGLEARADAEAAQQQLAGAVEALRRIGEPMGNRRLSKREAQAVAKSALDRARGSSAMGNIEHWTLLIRDRGRGVGAETILRAVVGDQSDLSPGVDGERVVVVPAEQLRGAVDRADALASFIRDIQPTLSRAFPAVGAKALQLLGGSRLPKP